MLVFWEKFDEVRKARGLTNKEVYSIADIGPATFSTWRTKDRLPPVDKALELADILNTSLSYLMGNESTDDEILLATNRIKKSSTPDFYDRVKIRVKELDTTIEALCDAVDLEIGTYRSMRLRNLLPRLNTIIAMSEALGVSLDYLAYGIQNPVSGIDSKHQEIVEAIKTIDDDSLSDFKTIAESYAHATAKKPKEKYISIPILYTVYPDKEDDEDCEEEPIYVSIPLYGSIAAGHAKPLTSEETGRVSIDAKHIPDDASNYFCLTIKGTSMIQAGIQDGNTVLMRHSDSPIAGKIFAIVDTHDNCVTIKRLDVDASTGGLILAWLDGSKRTAPFSDNHIVKGEYVRVV